MAEIIVPGIRRMKSNNERNISNAGNKKFPSVFSLNLI